MKKHDLLFIKVTANIFALNAAYSLFELISIEIFERELKNAGLFQVLYALTFGSFMLYSLNRIIKHMTSQLKSCEEKIEKLENKLREDENT